MSCKINCLQNNINAIVCEDCKKEFWYNRESYEDFDRAWEEYNKHYDDKECKKAWWNELG